MNHNLTELVYIIDMSGSMYHLTDDTIGGYNALLAEQKHLSSENSALRANVTTVLFDNRCITLHERADINTVPNMTQHEYVPCGSTALLDAVGSTIDEIGRKLAATPESERPGLVSVTIITDGRENASRTYTWDRVQAMIKEQREKYSWVFSFVGANIDVERTSESLGIDKKMSKAFSTDSKGTASVFASLSKGATSMRRMSVLRSNVNDMEDAMSDALDDIE